MTIAAELNRVSYPGNGATVLFGFNAPYRASTDFEVTLRVDATGGETPQLLNANYTIVGVPNANTGGFDSMNLTMLVAPAVGSTIVINRKVPPTSSYDPAPAAADTAPAREGAIDRVMLAIQGLAERVSRALLLPKSSPLADLALPEPFAALAGNLLGINGAGNGYALYAATLGVGVATSAFMQTLLDDPDAVTARATLGVPWPHGFLKGAEISRQAVDTFGIAAGNAVNENVGTLYGMTLAAAITKKLTAFVAGSGNGGLDAGGVAANTWYHVHLIRKDSDGTIDAIYSLSAAAPTMPVGYTARRRLGSFKTNGASQIIAFSQFGDEFLWDAAVIDVDAANPGAAAVNRTLSTPLGIKTTAMITVGTFSSTQDLNAVVSSLDVSDQAPQAAATQVLAGFSSAGGADTDSNWHWTEQRVRTDVNSQVRSRLSLSAATSSIGIVTRGWVDNRGRL